MECFWPCQGAQLTRLAAAAREAREHRLQTCGSDTDICHWLEVEKNSPPRKDREKVRPGGTPAKEVGVGVVPLVGHGQEVRAVWAAGCGVYLRNVKVRKPFIENGHPCSLPYSARR